MNFLNNNNETTLNEKQKKAVNSKEEKMVIIAPAGSGKALKNGTGVLTPKGYVPIETLQVGDIVYDGEGKETKISGVFPQGKKKVFNIIFSNGHTIGACEDHLWSYQTTYMRSDKSKNWKTKTVKEIIDTEPIQIKSGQYMRKNIFLPMYDYIDFQEQELLISPYLLGAMLGDGHFATKKEQLSFSNKDSDVLERVSKELEKYENFLRKNEKDDYIITSGKVGIYSSFKEKIRKLGLEGTKSDTKFIPKEYLFNSYENRLELLKGLIDTDGHCTGSAYEYITVSKQLADDFQFLVESLGMTAKKTMKMTTFNYKGEAKIGLPAHRFYIKTSKMTPKIHYSERREKQWKKGQSYSRITINDIQETDEFAEMTCISVESPTKLFVIERGIVTHNTTVLIQAIKTYMEEHPLDNIVAITFTRKAAEELSQRLGYAPRVGVSTIHSWALKELDNLSERIAKIDPTKSFKVKLLEEIKIKEILSDIAKKKRYYYVNIDIMYSYVMGNYQMDISDAMRQIFNTCLDKYIEFKRMHGLYDFTDLPEYLLDKLNDYELDLEHIDALFVDEFQDVDDVQVELFERVLAKKKLFIGDPKQSIYQFRGATEDVVRSLRGYKLFDLDVNYRSNQEIIDFATTYEQRARIEPITFSGQLESYKSAIFCERGDGGTVYVLARTGAAYKINEFLKERGEKIVSDFIALNPMILCRKNKEVKEIRDLGWDRVQTIHQAKGLEYEAVIVTDFEIRNLEDVNISYVGMTRAKSHLLAANYDAFIKIIKKLSSEGRLSSRETLF